MSVYSENNKRIAKNTLLLYIRMLLTMFVNLYASRIVLQTLGVNDFGLYNVVGGIVVMFTFLNGTLSTGTQRFLSFQLGINNKNKLKIVFSTSILLHTLLSLCIILLAETIGLWFLNNKMNIEPERMNAAFWVFQFSIIATVVNIIQVPFMSAIVAHEKMNIYAYMSIYDATMKLLIVFLIPILHYDKLILYAGFILFINITSALFYNFYCRKVYSECRLRFIYDKNIFKEMLSFSGWNIFGCLAVTCQGQGVNILLNIFFGTAVNAARGIAFQVNNFIIQFVNNFQMAVNPQIVKLYASEQKDEMTKLVLNNSKLAAFLLLFIAIPLFIEIEFILHLWLGEYPDYTPIFIRIVLIQSVIQTMTRPIVTVVHATGKLKMVNLTAGVALLMILPISYILLKLGYSPETIFIVNIIPWFFETFFELYWMKKYINFPLSLFYKQVYGKVFPLSIIMYLIPLIFSNIIPLQESIIRLLLISSISLITSSTIIYLWGIDKATRNLIKTKLTKIKQKLNK